MERRDLEAEILSYLAKVPKGRKAIHELGVDHTWFGDIIHQRVFKIIMDSDGVITDQVIQYQGGTNWETVVHSSGHTVETMIEAFQSSVLNSELISLFEELSNKGGNPHDIFIEAVKGLKGLEKFTGNIKEDLMFLSGISEVWENYIISKERKGLTGFPWPWITLNKYTAGINKGEFILFYGHPKAMKTWLWLKTAHNLWEKVKIPIALTSKSEMSKELLRRRWVALHAKVDYELFIQGRLKKKDEEKVTAAIEEIKELRKDAPVYFPEIRGVGEDAAREIRRKIEELEVAVFFLDAFNKLGLKWEELAAASKGAKETAQDTGCPIIGTAQTNRNLIRTSSGAKSTPDQDMAGSINMVQDVDVLIGTTKIGPSRLSLRLAAMRECPEKELLLKVVPAVYLDELEQANLEVGSSPDIY